MLRDGLSAVHIAHPMQTLCHLFYVMSRDNYLRNKDLRESLPRMGLYRPSKWGKSCQGEGPSLSGLRLLSAWLRVTPANRLNLSKNAWVCFGQDRGPVAGDGRTLRRGNQRIIFTFGGWKVCDGAHRVFVTKKSQRAKAVPFPFLPSHAANRKTAL